MWLQVIVYFHFYFPPHHCQRALTSNLECLIILIIMWEGAGSLCPAHEYAGSGLRGHSLPVELVQPAPARASSQSVSQSASKQAVGSAAAWPLCKLSSVTSRKRSDNRRRADARRGWRDITRKRSSMNLEPVLRWSKCCSPLVHV